MSKRGRKEALTGRGERIVQKEKRGAAGDGSDLKSRGGRREEERDRLTTRQ